MGTMVRYLHDETITLDDGVDYRHATFRNCRLIYTGGDIQIEGALFFNCGIKYSGRGELAGNLQRAIFASLYAQGVRALQLDEDGGFSTD